MNTYEVKMAVRLFIVVTILGWIAIHLMPDAWDKIRMLFGW